MTDNSDYLLTQIPFKNPVSHQVQRLFYNREHAYQGYEHVSIDWLSPIILITVYIPKILQPARFRA